MKEKNHLRLLLIVSRQVSPVLQGNPGHRQLESTSVSKDRKMRIYILAQSSSSEI